MGMANTARCLSGSVKISQDNAADANARLKFDVCARFAKRVTETLHTHCDASFRLSMSAMTAAGFL